MELLRRELDDRAVAAARRVVGQHVGARLRRAHPDRVSQIVLWGITTGRRAEADRWFRGGVAPLLPAQWAALRAGIPADQRDGDIVEAYSRMLHDADPEVRRRAALAWCTWESATPEWPPTGALDERYADPDFALAFARLVTHYVAHDFFLEDGSCSGTPTC
jgi:proline iminopeptidase